jgi:SAM-dependent methyltransferase
MVAMAATAEGTPRYRFKAAPYSSHALLLAEFPQRGDGRRVLDVGCAIGYLSEILAQRGFAVTSIDWPNSPHPTTVEFAGADLDNGLPPLRGQFDYIICADVLEHLRAPLRSSSHRIDRGERSSHLAARGAMPDRMVSCARPRGFPDTRRGAGYQPAADYQPVTNLPYIGRRYRCCKNGPHSYFQKCEAGKRRQRRGGTVDFPRH